MAEDRATEKVTKDDLKDVLEDAGKPVSGTKAELEERVAALDKEHRPDTFVARILPKG